MKTIMKTVACLFAMALAVTALTGCQTAEGFGEDMENAGESIQEKTQ